MLGTASESHRDCSERFCCSLLADRGFKGHRKFLDALNQTLRMFSDYIKIHLQLGLASAPRNENLWVQMWDVQCLSRDLLAFLDK